MRTGRRLGSFLLIILLRFLLIGETWCEVFLARTTNDTRLIDSDTSSFIPMTMARLIISLKEAARSQRPHLTLEAPNGLLTDVQDGHSPHPPRSPHAVDEIPLPVLSQGG